MISKKAAPAKPVPAPAVPAPAPPEGAADQLALRMDDQELQQLLLESDELAGIWELIDEPAEEGQLTADQLQAAASQLRSLYQVQAKQRLLSPKVRVQSDHWFSPAVRCSGIIASHYHFEYCEYAGVAMGC